MATITIRNLDEKVKRALQVRAAQNGRSMEAEVRAFLTEALSKGAGVNVQKEGLGTAIHNLFEPVWAVSEPEALESFETARLKYLPKPIRLVFVAEAPPRVGSKRFFYFPNVEVGDTLYLEMMKVLYPKDIGFSEVEGDEESHFSPKGLRARKLEFLSKFRDDGLFLVDAVDSPMPDGAAAPKKQRIIRNSLPALTTKLKLLSRTQALKIILIGVPVYQACNSPLREAGLSVLNKGPIDTPARGRQKEFRRKLRGLLNLHQIGPSGISTG